MPGLPPPCAATAAPRAIADGIRLMCGRRNSCSVAPIRVRRGGGQYYSCHNMIISCRTNLSCAPARLARRRAWRPPRPSSTMLRPGRTSIRWCSLSRRSRNETSLDAARAAYSPKDSSWVRQRGSGGRGPRRTRSARVGVRNIQTQNHRGHARSRSAVGSVKGPFIFTRNTAYATTPCAFFRRRPSSRHRC